MSMDASHSPDIAYTGKKIQVLVVDDHAVVRQGLRTFIDLQDDMEVVGEGVNGIQAVELVTRLNPDVILLDLLMPQMDGVEATRAILDLAPQSRVLILTSFGEDDKVFPAIRAGAQGYLLKDIQPLDLIKAVRDCYQGKVQLHPDITRRLMDAVSRDMLPHEEKQIVQPKDMERLTDREHEVLHLIAEGLTNRDIAVKLFISEKTVKTHVSNILGKLELADRTQAAIYAIRHGSQTDRK